MRLPIRTSAYISKERVPDRLGELSPALTEIEVLAPTQLPRVESLDAGVRADGVRHRGARVQAAPGAFQVHVDDGREGSRGAGLAACAYGVVVAAFAPEAGAVAAAAAGDCVAAQEEELHCDLAGWVHVESRERGESENGEKVTQSIHSVGGGVWLRRSLLGVGRRIVLLARVFMVGSGFKCELEKGLGTVRIQIQDICSLFGESVTP